VCPNTVVDYGDWTLLFAQTDPAWEYWDTSTYLAIAVTATLISTLAAWLVFRYWRKAKAQDYPHTN
jgi:H+/Cl- antiporter ClcA